MAGGGGGGGGGQQPDSGLGPLWVVITLFIGVWLLWILAHPYLVEGIFKLRLAEIAGIELVSNSVDPVKQFIQTTQPANVTFSELMAVSEVVGKKLTIPFALILLALAASLYQASTQNRFRRIYSMQSLVDQEKANWPQITPVSHLNLLETHIHEGPWAMCMTPMQFAKAHHLLIEERVPDGSGIPNKTKLIAKINSTKANRVFIKQLGRPWKDPLGLPIHYRALLAIFLAKANADRGPASQLIRQIAASAKASGKLDFTGVDEVLKKHIKSPLAEKIFAKHGYELTMMASILEVARLDGVLATAEFIWLKPLDRPLWYMLNNVGRRTAFTEVAGPIAHWLAEKLMDRPIAVPMIQQATIALTDAVAEVVYNPEQEF